MAALFLLLALIGGALVGDLVWENTSAGEVTVLDRTATTYPQGWLLAAAAATGFMIALLLVASVSSTKARRNRRREFRSVKRDLRDQAFEPEHASWLDEPVAREEPAGDTGVSYQPHSEPSYEHTRQARLHDDRGRGSAG